MNIVRWYWIDKRFSVLKIDPFCFVTPTCKPLAMRVIMGLSHAKVCIDVEWL